ncbi:MAG: hypothetical protein HY719_01925 [Planctomycetes bacterium]|nr:hypothetical protein [Planctomycetota bacterium]
MSLRRRLIASALFLAAIAGLFGLALLWNPAGHFVDTSDARVPLRFVKNEQCRACHQEIYDEWAGSMHALAWNDTIFQNEAKGREDCYPCHVPVPLFETGLGKRPLARVAARAEGIGCVECHLDVTRGMVAGVASPATGGPGGDCRPAYGPEISTPEFCAPCHDQHDTMKEWRASPFAASKNCNACHMLEVTRPIVPGGAPRLSHRHDFLGGHRIEEFEKTLGEPPVVVVASWSRANRRLRIALKNTGTGHNFPTDARFRVARLLLELRDAADRPLPPLGRVARVAEDGAPFKGDGLRPATPPVVEHFQYVFRDLGGEKNTVEADGLREYFYAVTGDDAATAVVRLVYKLVPQWADDGPPARTLWEERVDLSHDLPGRSLPAPGQPTVGAPPPGTAARVWPALADLLADVEALLPPAAAGEPPESFAAACAEFTRARPFEEGRAPVTFDHARAPAFAALRALPGDAVPLAAARRLATLAKDATRENGAERMWLLLLLGEFEDHRLTDLVAWHLEDPDPLVQGAAAFALERIGDRSALVRVCERDFTTADLAIAPGAVDRYGQPVPVERQRSRYTEYLVGRARMRLGSRAGVTAIYDYWQTGATDLAHRFDWLVDEMRMLSGQPFAHDPADPRRFYDSFSQWWAGVKGVYDLPEKALAKDHTDHARLDRLLAGHAAALAGLKYYLQDRSRWVFRFLEDLGVPALRAVLAHPDNQQALLGALAAIAGQPPILLPYVPEAAHDAARVLCDSRQPRAVRLEAARLLGWAADLPRDAETWTAAARAALEAALGDDDRDVVIAAVDALGRIRSADPQRLRALLADPRYPPADYEVRLLVDYALIRVAHAAPEERERFKGRAPFYFALQQNLTPPRDEDKVEFAVRKLVENENKLEWRYNPRDQDEPTRLSILKLWIDYLARAYPEEIAAYTARKP